MRAKNRFFSGVIEGGPQNYSGQGLQLPRGQDRQRRRQMSYVQDHGVEWRQNM